MATDTFTSTTTGATLGLRDPARIENTDSPSGLPAPSVNMAATGRLADLIELVLETHAWLSTASNESEAYGFLRMQVYHYS